MAAYQQRHCQSREPRFFPEVSLFYQPAVFHCLMEMRLFLPNLDIQNLHLPVLLFTVTFV